MSDDLVRRLECYADLSDAVYHPWVYREAADRIKKLEEENGVLFAANVRLNSRADLDCDHYRDRIEKLEAELHSCFHRIEELQAALREIAKNDSVQAGLDYEMYRRWRRVATDSIDIARKALEGKDD